MAAPLQERTETKRMNPKVFKKRPGILKRALWNTRRTLTRVNRKTALVSPKIPGWFSMEEAEALHLLAATTTATRILEVGHFLGRSTSAICEGIRDGGLTIEFNSYDLGFTTARDFIDHYQQIHDEISCLVPPEFEELVFSQKKTTTELARIHLSRFGLDRFVNLISGDFTVLEQTRYGFVFCDALHDRGEIAINLPHIVNASEDDCVWAFHDMNADNIAEVLRQSTARLAGVADTLGIFRFRRE